MLPEGPDGMYTAAQLATARDEVTREVLAVPATLLCSSLPYSLQAAMRFREREAEYRFTYQFTAEDLAAAKAEVSSSTAIHEQRHTHTHTRRAHAGISRD